MSRHAPSTNNSFGETHCLSLQYFKRFVMYNWISRNYLRYYQWGMLQKLLTDTAVVFSFCWMTFQYFIFLILVFCLQDATTVQAYLPASDSKWYDYFTVSLDMCNQFLCHNMQECWQIHGQQTPTNSTNNMISLLLWCEKTFFSFLFNFTTDSMLILLEWQQQTN